MALLAAYNFDEASGAVLDASGDGRNFTLTANTVRTAAGHTSQGLTQDALGIQNGPAVFGLTANRTMMMWVKSSGLVADGRVLEVGSASDSNSIWEFLMRDTLWHLQAWNASTFARATTSRPTDGAWHHLAGSYDGTSLRLYLDGTLVATTALAGPLRTDGTTFRIFVNSGPTTIIDDVRHYDTALDVATIAALMATPVSTGGSSFTGSVALSGSGALTGTGSPASAGVVALSGSGTLTAIGTPGHKGATALTGAGSLTTAGQPALGMKASLQLAGTGQLAAVSLASARDLTLTAVIEPDRWTSTLEPDRWGAGIEPNRWEGTVPWPEL